MSNSQTSNHALVASKFSWSFLLPKYWLTWCSLILLYAISWLPYSWQMQLGKGLGWLLSKLARKRIAIAKRNLALCFPQWSEQKREKILKQNIQHAGQALLEAGIGWWWPDWRIRKIGRVEGYEHVQAILDKGKGVLGLAIHNMHLEAGGRVVGLHKPSAGFYRRHNNALMEWLQFKGRMRSNKYMIPKKDIKGLIWALDQGELCLYLPDQDYGAKRCEFTPFFAVEQTATTTGTLLFAKEANCEIVFIQPVKDKRGYAARFLPGLQNFPSGDDNYDVARINKQIETMILEAPEQYLWMHKRFKTRPAGEPSLYE